MTICKFISLGSIGVILVMQVGCVSDTDPHGSGEGINQSTQALASGELLSANGTYGASCRNRTGAWSVEIASGAMLDNPALSVVLKDTACVLTLTQLHTSLGGAIVATPAVTLTTSYKLTPSSFGSPIEFYGNARLSAVSFANDFVLQVLYSDDPSLATGDNTANFDVVESTATAASVAAPTFVLNVGALQLLTDVSNIVVSATGAATLTADVVTDQRYVVMDLAGLTTYAEIDAAYILGTDAALTASIPAADFALVMDDLTTSQVRTLIIANISEGVRSYQVFEITFHKAVITN